MEVGGSELYFIFFKAVLVSPVFNNFNKGVLLTQIKLFTLLFLTLSLCMHTYQVWAPGYPAADRPGWNLSAGTWASATSRRGCAWRRLPWGAVCGSHLLGKRGWGFPLGQPDGRIWQWPWKTWPQQKQLKEIFGFLLLFLFHFQQKDKHSWGDFYFFF